MITTKARLLVGVSAIVLVGAVTIAAIVPKAVLSRRPVHEIRLVARDMAYYADGKGAPNPTLTVARGEQVRIVLRNEDPGMIHDFAVPSWNAVTRRLAAGEETVLQFNAPEQPGLGTYSCTPHGELMRGTIRVE